MNKFQVYLVFVFFTKAIRLFWKANNLCTCFVQICQSISLCVLFRQQCLKIVLKNVYIYANVCIYIYIYIYIVCIYYVYIMYIYIYIYIYIISICVLLSPHCLCGDSCTRARIIYILYITYNFLIIIYILYTYIYYIYHIYTIYLYLNLTYIYIPTLQSTIIASRCSCLPEILPKISKTTISQTTRLLLFSYRFEPWITL